MTPDQLRDLHTEEHDRSVDYRLEGIEEKLGSAAGDLQHIRFLIQWGIVPPLAVVSVMWIAGRIVSFISGQ